MCMVDNGDKYAVWSCRDIKQAKKEHFCEECARTIATGESYRMYGGCFQGDKWNQHPTCQHCVTACRWLIDTCSGFVHGGVEEDIRAHAQEYRRMDLYRLSAMMRRQWRKKNGHLYAVPKVLDAIEVAP